jgi:hypothetical protein
MSIAEAAQSLTPRTLAENEANTYCRVERLPQTSPIFSIVFSCDYPVKRVNSQESNDKSLVAGKGSIFFHVFFIGCIKCSEQYPFFFSENRGRGDLSF